MADQNNELEVIELADGSIEVREPGQQSAQDTGDGDERTGSQVSTDGDDEGDDEGDDQGDEQGNEAPGEDDDRRAAGDADSDHGDRTEQNRQRRHDKKQRIRERNERLRNELAARDALINELSGRLAAVERRSTGTEMAHIDNEMRKVADAYGFYKSQIAEAHGRPEGGAIAADAAEKMALARQRYDQLSGLRTQMMQAQNRPSPIDTRVVNQAQAWAGRNTWYDPTGRDEASRIAMSVDESLAQEGWHPGTPEFWKELDRRLKVRLPEKYNSGNNRGSSDKPPPRSVVTGSGRETGRPGPTGKGYTLSADRVKALKDAGMWDDLALRNDMIRRYRDADRQNSN